MRLVCIGFLLLCFVGVGAQETKKVQRFNPVYSNQEEINQLLSFVSSNIKVELSENQVQNVNGQMVCRFRIDTTGRIYNITVFRSLKPWIDIAILGAMVRLPHYGIVSIDRRGRKQDVERQLVFSFGKSTFYAVNRMGFDGDAVNERIARSIDEQRSTVHKEKRRQAAAWDGFTKHNATLKYDTRDALKGSYPVLPGATDGLKPLSPVYTPTISIGGVGAAERLEAPAKVSAPE